MKIYTKKGDRGETSLIGGKRVPKNHTRVEAYGTVDELISAIGIVRACETDSYYKKFILDIQNNLMNIAAILAAEGDTVKKLPEISAEDLALLENEIDRITETLPKLDRFVIPGGNVPESFAHLSRSICRRAERIIVSLTKEGYPVPELVEAYINRLSDFLFTFARRLNKEAENADLWIPKTK
ncbi:MAG: cob(I)yrinic acid a,c-diamide adenosyltransferase [Prevotellaceae bacterium]|jgi:cob(I)alamin adenosyltransferase|nr:cob(I)yrinic acid a,c-diamide adenosyltransferase [Prevotellaceae bacterium]